MHACLNMVANVARPSVFARLHTLAFYAAVKSRQVFALLLQTPADAPLSHLAPPSSSCSLFYIPRPLNRTSCGKRGERFEESHKAKGSRPKSCSEPGWWLVVGRVLTEHEPQSGAMVLGRGGLKHGEKRETITGRVDFER